MPGTRAGALKARNTNITNDPNFYSKIGKRSWNNPERSHETGFAKLPKDVVVELGRKGGKKTKSDYKTTQRTEEEFLTAEELQALYLAEDLDGPSISE